MSTESPIPAKVRTVRERHEEKFPAFVHADWAVAFPWLLQGTTTRGAPEHEFDFGLFSEGTRSKAVQEHWHQLLTVTGMRVAIHAPQVHEANVRLYQAGGDGSGLQLIEACDGHITNQIGVLLAVTTADCVPIFLVEPQARVVGVLHAGWRGALGGVLEAATHSMESLGGDVGNIKAAIGPCISQKSYEVGREFLERFQISGFRSACFFKAAQKKNHYLFDLEGYVAKRLEARGIRRIERCGVDTYEDSGRCYSFRRSQHLMERDYGRSLSVITVCP